MACAKRSRVPKPVVRKRHGVVTRYRAPPKTYRVVAAQAFEVRERIVLCPEGSRVVVRADSGIKIEQGTSLKFVFESAVRMPVGALYADEETGLMLTDFDLDSMIEKGYLKRAR